MSDETQSAGDSNANQPARIIGPYHLLQQIGEGGMGTVWLAQQDQPVRRRVALKLIKTAAADEQVIGRFEAERQALAIMDHPHIAKILDAGTTEDGAPYFVMELVNGIAITDYCDRQKLSPRERLELFIPICSAIQHAHQKGIIHRDIKPSNVLVAMQDGKPVAKVIDFGLAKALQHQIRLNDKTMFTEFGQVLGTVRYMSPEQATLDALDIDTRTDVYSLGVLLYELMTGSTPIEEDTIRDHALLRVLEFIREKEPPRPSHRLSSSMDKLDTVSDRRRIQPTKLQQMLRGDIDWIIMRALEKDRTRRYESAHTFADDIRRYLNGDAVVARPPSASYRFRKFVRKNRAPVAAALAMILLLVAGITGTTWFAVDAQSARVAAESSAEQSREALKLVTDSFKSLDPHFGGDAEMPARTVLVNLRDALDSSKLDDEGRALVLGTLTESFGHVGDYKAALAVVLRELEVSRRLYGADDERTLAAQSNLAFLRSQLGDFQEAIRIQEETLEIAQNKLGPSHGVTIMTMANLANSFFAVDQRDRAIELFEKAMKAGNASDDEVARLGAKEALIALSEAYVYTGRHQKAIDLLRPALTELITDLGGDHPVTMNAMVSLGVAYHQLGNYEAALQLREKTLATQRMKLGKEHPSTQVTMNNLANTYNAMGRSEEAIATHEQVFDIRVRTLGEEHPFTLMTMQNLGKAYLDADRHQEAVDMLRRNLELRKKILGPQHNHTLMTMTRLTAAYYKLGQYADAAELIERRLAITRSKHGDEHRQTLTVTGDLAVIYRTLGRTDESVALFEQIVSSKTRAVGRDHPETLAHIYGLAESYLAAGRVAEAIEAHEDVLEKRRLQFGPEHLTVKKSTYALANAYQATDRMSEAIPLFEEVVDYYTARSGERHSETLVARNALGSAYLAVGRIDDAVAIHETVTPELIKLVGANGQHAILGIHFLAIAYEAAGRFEEAIPLYEQALAAWETKLGEAHVETLHAMLNLARTQLAVGAEKDSTELASECINRTKDQPQLGWAYHYAHTIRGAAALRRGELDEAERLLLRGYEGLKQMPMLSSNRKQRFREVLNLMVTLAKQRQRPDEVARWQEALRAASD